MSRQVCRLRESSSSEGPPAKKRTVSKRTVEKWVAEYDCTLNTTVWLKFNLANWDHMASLRCAVCTQFKEKTCFNAQLLSSLHQRNHQRSNINVQTSMFKEHAATSMHERAIGLFKKQQSSSVCGYAPIAVTLLQPSMDEATCTWTKCKFDVAYMIAKENLPFTKMKAMCKLVEQNGAELGQGYKNDQACATFI